MAYSSAMAVRFLRRAAALLLLAALVVSPALAAGSGCLSACGMGRARAPHACCRPSGPAAPLVVRGPGCCRPGPASAPAARATPVEPAFFRHAVAIAAAGMVAALMPLRSIPPAAVFATVETPPPLLSSRAVLRI